MSELNTTQRSLPATPAAIILSTRQAREQTQAAFGAELGVLKQYVSTWERGRVSPGPQTITRWARDRREWVRELAHKIATALYPFLAARFAAESAAVPVGEGEGEEVVMHVSVSTP